MSSSALVRGHGLRTGGRVRACRRGALLGALCLTVAAATARAQTPVAQTFTYQGRLMVAGSPADGAYDFRFQLYDAPDGGSQVGPTTSADDVFVSTGLFTVGLNFGAAFTGQNRFLEVAVRPGSSTGAYETVSGRHNLTPSPMALYGLTAPWTGVLSKPPGFADNVDNDVLGGLVCGPNQLAKWNGSTWACANDIDTNTIYTADPAGGLSLVNSAFSILPGGVATARLADNAVTNAKLADAAVGTTKMLDQSVTSGKLVDGSVGTVKLAAGAVTGPKIANAAVVGIHVAPNAIVSTHLSDNAVGRPEIGGTEVPLYQGLSECGSTELTLSATCLTVICTTPPVIRFYECNGVCVATSPQQCNTTLRGYLLGTAIP